MGGRRGFVGGNWKCNGNKESIRKLLGLLNSASLSDSVDVVVAPPAVYLEFCKNFAAANIQVSAQNCHDQLSGAFTGATSPAMLKDLEIPYVILGHSERRTVFGESDELIGNKAKVALETGLKVIFCIGEQLEERESGKTMDVVIRQLSAAVSGINNWDNVVIAYEPVWAIGTGKTASPEQAQEVHEKIRAWISEKVSAEVAANVRIIYGGSVKKANCADLASQTDIDGFLVGGASLIPEFVDIINSMA